MLRAGGYHRDRIAASGRTAVRCVPTRPRFVLRTPRARRAPTECGRAMRTLIFHNLLMLRQNY